MLFYRLLLHLYPTSFRQEYATEMCAIFTRRRRETSSLGLLFLWMAAIFETLWNAAGVHADVLRQDLRYTTRSLRRTPGFALTAVLVVAIGVGANTAAFSLADRTLLRPLPFPQSERLVKLWEAVPGYTRMELSPANYRDWKSMNRSFEVMGAYDWSDVNLVGQGEPERLSTATVSSEILPMLGIQPLMGRVFGEADDVHGASGTLLLSYTWRTSSWTMLP